MTTQSFETSPLLNTAISSVRKTSNTNHRFFKICCIKSKPALMILLWSSSVLLGYNFMYNTKVLLQSVKPSSPLKIIALLLSILGTIMFISPMAGLLADIKFGHYKTVLYSSFIIIITVGLMPVYSVIFIVRKDILTFHDLLKRPVLYFTLVAMVHLAVLLISVIIFTTNAINFGMDQLHDASTQDLILYIHWYVWLNYLCTLVAEVPWSLLFYDILYQDYVDNLRIAGISLVPLIFVIIFLLLIVSLCVVRHRRRWFLIASNGRVNPYKLVYRVVKFAWYHKIPVCRSAFTYCEDEWPSRLDLGKQKYGGPFTVEQVEDVKAFLGILKVLFSIVPLFMLQVVSESTLPLFSVHNTLFFKPNTSAYRNNIRIEGIIHYLFLSSGLLSPLLVVVSLPLYLFLLRPFITYHVPGLLKTILKRIGVGLFLIILSLLCALAMDVIVHHMEDRPCMLLTSSIQHTVTDEFSSPRLYQNVYFFISQHVLSALYNMLIDIAVFEFICSQSPYSMKGLLIGAFFSLRSLSQSFALLLMIPFSTSWKASYPLSCGSGFYITSIVIGVTTLFVYVCVAKNYKYRMRDEPSKERQYAEEYYSNVQDE